MKYHTDDEKALIESFRAAGGERFILFRHGEPRLPAAMAEALARLVRSGHIRRHGSPDVGWASYRLREGAEEEAE
ncbi:hypothetical protein OJF2_36310 [Aquisphaera giovannonii]|uniref:Uncharacterized protein n=1 Tax=Aquisphaera giovannonii TaxID=406548 RepID=A0A5B9W397_9BACT|nr:hypothetical protein [Aquisphaera giovannonii]QEH35086.1 hypothetical protein OJF2_36310 [Aquisphaera giovannonii]